MKELLPHQVRVIEEKEALEDKMSKLDAFIAGAGMPYIHLSDMEQRLLSMQLSTMQAYHAILSARISLF